ncbi:unnamed protein product [Heligmosomoides polygyrus]|uniref:Porin n=1 Tax=Heligmosomoides polygyrus TaxID=6339 RepID=A0A183F5T5_HELPZ|nr:unnamed protein product [Heligmosomoides polygyrus]
MIGACLARNSPASLCCPFRAFPAPRFKSWFVKAPQMDFDFRADFDVNTGVVVGLHRTYWSFKPAIIHNTLQAGNHTQYADERPNDWHQRRDEDGT